jgi:hypothetical protein
MIAAMAKTSNAATATQASTTIQIMMSGILAAPAKHLTGRESEFCRSLERPKLTFA